MAKAKWQDKNYGLASQSHLVSFCRSAKNCSVSVKNSLKVRRELMIWGVWQYWLSSFQRRDTKLDRNYEIIIFCVHWVLGSWGFLWCGFHLYAFSKNSPNIHLMLTQLGECDPKTAIFQAYHMICRFTNYLLTLVFLLNVPYFSYHTQ